jgi:hypothetical protein
MLNDRTWTTSVRWTPEIDRKLTRMVTRVLAAQGRTSRSELLAALVSAQDPRLDQVTRLLEAYREKDDGVRVPSSRSKRRRRPGPVMTPQSKVRASS